MAGTERSPVRARAARSTPSASAISVAQGEEGRAFLQERMALTGRIGAAISALFALLLNGWAIGSGRVGFSILRLPANLWHFAEIAILALMGGVCCIGRIPRRALLAIDATVLLGISICHGFMGIASHAVERPAEYASLTILPNPLPMVMATLFVLLARTIVVPSTPRWTAFVSLLATTPIVLASYELIRRSAFDRYPGLATNAAVYTAIWSAGGAVLATIASAVVYRLHARAIAAEELGQYVLEEKIGEGGMGIVFRARHAMLRRPTAIKLLPPEKAGEQTIARFEREVQITASLTHPNTIAIFDYGRTPDGTFYYAMELVEGLDLEEIVRGDGPMPPARALRVLVQICEALDEAHAAGLIHRDVKPANVLLCERGRREDVVKVVDFGLVKEVRTDHDVALSATNVLIGTPLYLAPEAILSPEGIDRRVDIYAVGCVAYWLLTGRTPFEAQSLVEICAHHLHSKARPPSDFARGLPRALDEIVLSCLEKTRDARPEDAASLARALGAVLATLPPWTDDDAARWWSQTGHRLRGGRRSASHGGATTASGARPRFGQRTLPIDLAARER